MFENLISHLLVVQALGARSQAARTYLERNFSTFDACSMDQLIVHALTGLLHSQAHLLVEFMKSDLTYFFVCSFARHYSVGRIQ